MFESLFFTFARCGGCGGGARESKGGRSRSFGVPTTTKRCVSVHPLLLHFLFLVGGGGCDDADVLATVLLLLLLSFCAQSHVRLVNGGSDAAADHTLLLLALHLSVINCATTSSNTGTADQVRPRSFGQVGSNISSKQSEIRLNKLCKSKVFLCCVGSSISTFNLQGRVQRWAERRKEQQFDD